MTQGQRTNIKYQKMSENFRISIIIYKFPHKPGQPGTAVYCTTSVSTVYIVCDVNGSLWSHADTIYTPKCVYMRESNLKTPSWSGQNWDRIQGLSVSKPLFSHVTGDFITLSWLGEREQGLDHGMWALEQTHTVFPSTWCSLNIESTLI